MIVKKTIEVEYWDCGYDNHRHKTHDAAKRCGRISNLPLTRGVIKALTCNGIKSIKQLRDCSKADLLKIPGIGEAKASVLIDLVTWRDE